MLSSGVHRVTSPGKVIASKALNTPGKFAHLKICEWEDFKWPEPCKNCQES